MFPVVPMTGDHHEPYSSSRTILVSVEMTLEFHSWFLNEFPSVSATALHNEPLSSKRTVVLIVSISLEPYKLCLKSYLQVLPIRLTRTSHFARNGPFH